ncbi:MAG: hypothetical protein WC460_06920 [Patescibacteria group bacterium]
MKLSKKINPEIMMEEHLRARIKERLNSGCVLIKDNNLGNRLFENNK